ncbi:unnamed protein product, partial [Heterosigma akashiwo]
TPLHCAVHFSEPGQNNDKVVRQLLEAGSDANATALSNITGMGDNCTPVHFAAWHGTEQAMRQLVAAGANLEACTEYQRTPLHLAAQRGRVELIRQLVGAGANLEARDTNQSTPLHLA